MEQFAILHEFEDTQCLIDSTYDHEEETFSINLKFWSTTINGFLSMKLGYTDEENFKAAFEKLKSKDEVKNYMEGINSAF